MLIELHLIQNFAPSNLNRDDTNNPKDCEFGGVRRARISSQCIKRATRLDSHFQEYTGVPVSQRTKLMIDALVKLLTSAGLDGEKAQHRATEFARAYSSKKNNLDKNRTVVMLFLSQAELEEITARLMDIGDTDADIKKLADEIAKNNKNRPGAPDIALFGRMLADRPETNLDAACQVAHAISTHRVNMELDFFTAVDDLQPGEETGAGMMGVGGFNSACFYRYSVIDFNQLVANLNGDVELARKTVQGFLYASVFAVPTGKQNSHAAQNPPSFLMAAVRQDGLCWSMANAFEKPVHANAQKSLVEASIAALDAYWAKLSGFYPSSATPIVACLDGQEGLTHLKNARVSSMTEWVEAVLQHLPQE